MTGRRVWLWWMAAATLLAAVGCSWFPLVDYPPPPPSTAADEPAKVIDLRFSGTEN